MYLSHLIINNFRLFGKKTIVKLYPGLNLLVGENGCGKSAVIDAIRVLLNESEFNYKGITHDDFYCEYTSESTSHVDHIFISGFFSDLSNEQKVEYLPWLTPKFSARLNIEYQNRDNSYGSLKQKRWGGNSSSIVFEWELLNDIQCVYLPPLRDAERQLRAGRGSRLARFITNLSAAELIERRKKHEKMPLEIEVERFNSSIAEKDQIKNANELINESLINAAGIVFGQSTKIQFNELTYERIVESLRLLYSPDIGEDASFRSLCENSLGYNNLIYIATILAEFEGLKSQFTSPRILLIEELEAHLHPQLQAKLLKYLSEQAEKNEIQIIISTHSTTLAAATPLNKIITFTKTSEGISITPIRECSLEEASERFINRWLDATKSILLFSKGNIFVEGIAEAMLVPKLAEIYLKQYAKTHTGVCASLEEAGISVVNMNGIYYQHFMQLYKGYRPIVPQRITGEKQKEYEKRVQEFLKKPEYTQAEARKTQKLPIRCVALTDNDPPAKEVTATTDEGERITIKIEQKPTKTTPIRGTNPQLYLQKQLSTMTENCRVYSNLKTFEYDLAIESHHNAAIMISVILKQLKTDGPIRKKFERYQDILEQEKAGEAIELDDAEMALNILEQIESSYLGKGLFAQLLSLEMDDDFNVPEYIQNAIRFILSIEG